MRIIRFNPVPAVLAPQHCSSQHPELFTVLAQPMMFSVWHGQQGRGNSCETAKQIDPVRSSPERRTDAFWKLNRYKQKLIIMICPAHECRCMNESNQLSSPVQPRWADGHTYNDTHVQQKHKVNVAIDFKYKEFKSGPARVERTDTHQACSPVSQADKAH